MYEDWIDEAEDMERIRRRKARIQEMRRRKRRAELIQKRVFPAGMAAVLIIAAVWIGAAEKNAGGGSEGNKDLSGDSAAFSDEEQKDSGSAAMSQAGAGLAQGVLGKAERYPEGEIYGPFLPPGQDVFSATADSGTADFPADVISGYGILIDVENEAVLAQREGWSLMYPASMTKILTVLTAAEALGIEDEDWRNAPVLDEKFTITIEITDYCFVNECSNAGFEVGEEVTVRDLFYGTILPSGGDAALGLACFVAGSQGAFVELMNQELERLKLSKTTHFTNCIGLFDSGHYSTVYDMAVILKTAADNPFCREVLSARTYNTSPTEQHPEGLLISNLFLRKIEDKDTHGEMICGKTGYVTQSRSCAASLARDVNGREYICVTAGSAGSSKCINDQVVIYQTWLAGE